ncbi:MAG: Xaa-Pro peptidase family protein [Rhodospirillaceae bacterium]
MNTDVLTKIVDAARGAGLDAIVACSPENFAYVAGFVVPSHHVLRWRHSLLVIKSDGTVFAFTVDMEKSTVEKNLPEVPLITWGEFTDNSMQVFARMLSDLGLGRARIGIETDYISGHDLEILQKELVGVELTPAQTLFNEARMIKTPRELKSLHRLSRVSDASLGEALASVNEGSTEMDIAASLTRGIYTRGAEDFKFMIVATGERSRLPNVGPTERVLQAGDICRVEIFSIIKGYHAGVCRTASVGDPPDHAERIWGVLSDATQELLGLIKPGASSRSLYDAYLEMIRSLEMPPISFVGHGIGQHLHEDPYLGRVGDWELKPGMVLGIEPLIYETGHGFGMQNKDMVAVTETGCLLLSDVTDTTTLLRCGNLGNAASK